MAQDNENERLQQAATEYAIARQLDPQYPIYSWQNEIEDAFMAGVQYGKKIAMED